MKRIWVLTITCTMLLILLVTLLSIILPSYAATSSPIVTIQQGQLRGTKNQTVAEGKNYFAYRGIPYAEPPIGQNRFEPPKPKAPWIGVLNAVDDGSMCTQGIDVLMGSEDCLFVNVYVPETSQKNLSVLVWIHGGGFKEENSEYKRLGPDYLLEKEIIVVTLNYRLGIFGFLSTLDLAVPGNLGLKDQRLALQWVQENIAAFGGDPQKVTLSGESAGAVCVHYHMLSPKSQGLFRAVIMQSSSALGPCNLFRNVNAANEKLAEVLHIKASSTQGFVDQLKKVDFKTLHRGFITATKVLSLMHDMKDGIIFAPTVEPNHDDAVITERTYELMSTGQFLQVPTLIGYNSLEMYYGIAGFGVIPFSVNSLWYENDHSRMVPVSMNANNIHKTTIGQKIKEYYFANNVIMGPSLALGTYLSDEYFVRSICKFIEFASKYVPVYFYRFSHMNKYQPYSGVAHYEDIYYIWRFQNAPMVLTPESVGVRNQIVTYWTNFVKHLNPTPNKTSVIWSPTNANFTYLDIDVKPEMKSIIEWDRVEFWNNLFKLYGHPPYDTF